MFFFCWLIDVCGICVSLIDWRWMTHWAGRRAKPPTGDWTSLIALLVSLRGRFIHEEKWKNRKSFPTKLETCSIATIERWVFFFISIHNPMWLVKSDDVFGKIKQYRQWSLLDCGLDCSRFYCASQFEADLRHMRNGSLWLLLLYYLVGKRLSVKEALFFGSESCLPSMLWRSRHCASSVTQQREVETIISVSTAVWVLSTQSTALWKTNDDLKWLNQSTVSVQWCWFLAWPEMPMTRSKNQSSSDFLPMIHFPLLTHFTVDSVRDPLHRRFSLSRCFRE